MPASPQILGPIEVTSDDERAIADAGLMLASMLIARTGPSGWSTARFPAGYPPVRKLLTVVSTLLGGGGGTASRM
jgi:hypothetical protein